MRRTTSGRPLLAALAGVLALSLTAPAAIADPQTPSQEDVDRAERDAQAAERTVAEVQTDLVLANQRLEAASIKAAQAGEAYSAAKWELDQAAGRVKAADRRSATAGKKLAEQEESYFALLASTYEMSPGLTSLNAMASEQGIEGVLENSNTVYNVNSSMGDITSSYEAARTVADLATGQAQDARDAAARLEKGAAQARLTAEGEAQAAMAASTSVAKQKDALLAELAELQGISVDLATRRQASLEEAAQRRRAAAAAAEQQRASEQAQTALPADDSNSGDTTSGGSTSGSTGGSPGGSTGGDSSSDNDSGGSTESTPDPEPAPAPTPKPAPRPSPTPPPSSGGASAAISFARAQIGEPYVWAAAGPSSWDCSGLTMMAWRQGGKSLPHYSVGQYSATTPISAGSLKAGDLVFWGSSSSPSSIYHVALYAGNGRIIHAPRTGRPVTEESLYYWIPPNFYGRP